MLVFFIVPLSGVNIDIYVPSLPAVSLYFHTTKKLTQLTISAYLLGLGIMQLFAGSISDSFGRKKPFITAMVAYIISTLCIPYAQDMYQFIALRFIQGAVLAVLIVPMRSVISDLFEGEELQKMMTYMTMSWSLGPIIAPGIGGYLQYYWGWSASFYFLGLYSLITLVLSFFYLFETSSHKHPFKVKEVLQRYQRMLVHREYRTNISLGGLLFSLITLFGIAGSFFIQNVLHYNALQFGRCTLILGLAWFLGSMTNRFILHITLERKAKLLFWLMLGVTLMMLLSVYRHPMSIYSMLIPLFFLFYCSGILYPSYFISSVLLFRESSASANALFNSSAFFIAGICSGLGTFIRVHSAVPFTTVLILLISLCLLAYYRSLKPTQKKPFNISLKTNRRDPSCQKQPQI